jgi:hypothetical protein
LVLSFSEFNFWCKKNIQPFKGWMNFNKKVVRVT